MLPTSHRYHYSYTGASRARASPSTAAVVILCLVCFLLGKYVDNVLKLGSLSFPRNAARNELNERSALETDGNSSADSGVVTAADQTTAESGTDDGVVKATTDGAAKFMDPDLTRIARALSHEVVTETSEGRQYHTSFPYQILSWHPRVQLYHNFLTDEECDEIVAIGERRLAPSQLALKKGDDPNSQKDVRTSSGTFLTRHDAKSDILERIEERIADVTMIPASFGEAFNLLRYVNGQHYDAHYDLFRQEDYGPQSSNRLATVLLYLSDVEEGGETVFPFEGRDGLKRRSEPGFSYKDCSKGLKVKPRKGSAVVFWSLKPDGSYDDHSLHGGCPTIVGTKWAMTKWIRNKDQRGTFYQ